MSCDGSLLLPWALLEASWRYVGSVAMLRPDQVLARTQLSAKYKAQCFTCAGCMELHNIVYGKVMDVVQNKYMLIVCAYGWKLWYTILIKTPHCGFIVLKSSEQLLYWSLQNNCVWKYRTIIYSYCERGPLFQFYMAYSNQIFGYNIYNYYSIKLAIHTHISQALGSTTCILHLFQNQYFERAHKGPVKVYNNDKINRELAIVLIITLMWAYWLLCGKEMISPL